MQRCNGGAETVQKEVPLEKGANLPPRHPVPLLLFQLDHISVSLLSRGVASGAPLPIQ
jgi:hypothetical protein